MQRDILVGVTADWNRESSAKYLRVDERVIKWLKNENIIPIVFPPLPGLEDEMIQNVSGIILPGGRDIHPKFYGAIVDENAEQFCDEERTYFEFALLWRCARSSIPVLGLCLGCQVINVAFGGSLIFHLDDPKKRHRGNSGRSVLHRLHIKEHSFLKEFNVTYDTRVSSSHHQAILRVADSFKPTAYGPDKVIEAIESDEFPLIKGVQWHPERTPRSHLSKNLLKWFKNKCLERTI